MRITKHFHSSTKTFIICLREHKLGEITVSTYRPFACEGGNPTTWNKPTINWAGCGDKSVADTDKFIEGLTIAKHLAHCLENDVESPSIKIDNA